MIRPIEEHCRPEDVNFIEGAEELYQQGLQPSAESIVYEIIEKRCKKNELTSAKMLRDITGLGRTSIRYRLNGLITKRVIIRKFAVARTGNTKTILPFYVVKERKDLFKSSKFNNRKKTR